MKAFMPVGYVIGRLTAVMGASMSLPALVDFLGGSPNWIGFANAAFITMVAGLGLSMITRPDRSAGLSRQQAFLLTVLVWLVLPIFAALPFVFGEPGASYTDAFFEAMSGLTTTGATVFEELDEAARGMLLWRALLQWYGGVGIVVFAIVFLPVLKIGGMQFFKSEAFDLTGDILPRASEAASQLGLIYATITIACAVAYSAAGMTPFEAICHAMTTVSTGGYGTYNDGFERFSPLAHYIAVVFMWLAAWPFLRFVQLVRGDLRPLWRDPQIRAFVGVVLVVTAVMTAYLVAEDHHPFGQAVREALFNVTSIMTGTGYASDDYNSWGGLPVALFFIIALIGGCSGSTSCSAKIFRYQILFASLTIQLKRIYSPHGVYPLRYDQRTVDPEVLSSVMGFFFVFVASMAVWAVLLSLTGLDTITSISGAVATLANVGPGLGEVIGPAGNYASLDNLAKWILSAGMLLGRLEFMSVLVLLTPMFWAR